MPVWPVNHKWSSIIDWKYSILDAGGISVPGRSFGSALPRLCSDRLLQTLPDQSGNLARRANTWITQSSVFRWDIEEALNSAVHGYLSMKLTAGERPPWRFVTKALHCAASVPTLAALTPVTLLQPLSSNPWWPLQALHLCSSGHGCPVAYQQNFGS